MKKILITGGAGFVGSNLCHKLIELGNHVICLDNLYTGFKSNINELMNNNNFEFVEHDICETYFNDVDEIFNLASPASPIHYQSKPLLTTKTSVLGSLNMLELAKKVNCKILQASTSEVYGDPKEHPQKENYWGNVNPVGLRSCYDEGKRCAETIFMDYFREYNINIKIIRIFNTYGPNMNPNDGRVVSNFIVQALTNKNITIYGDGSQTRSFQYVDDLIEGMLRVMKTDFGYTGPVNLGNPDEFTVKYLAEKVIELTGSSSKIKYLKLPEDDPKMRRPEISKAKKDLDGWIPNVNLNEGLSKTIKYFEKKLKNGLK